MTSETAIVSIPQAEAYVFPTSFAQQRLWFLDQLAPQNPFYNVPAAVQLSGWLNVPALEQALNEMVCRHETLRTSFKVIEGQPMQAIVPHLMVPLPLVDLRSLPLTTRAARQQQLILEESQQPFDLTQSPLLRAKLLRLEATQHLLLLTLHHIVSDGWSIGVMMRELGTLYAAFAAGNLSPLPQLPIQYADFALWQRQWLQDEVLESQLDYWRQQLADLPVLDLSGAIGGLDSDRLRPPSQSYCGATRHLELSGPLSQALEDLSQQAGVTLFITLLAAFQTLLYRYTGQTDIPVGSPIANRNRSELEELIGFFVNTLVLRTDLSGNPTFRELLDRVRQVALGAYSHQDLPFEQLVEALQPARSLSHTPLVQVMFALQSAPTPPLELVGLTLEFLEVESHVAKFDLTLSFENTAQGLKGSLEYSTDLFEADSIDRLLTHFHRLLESIVANPDQPIARLPLLSAPEQQQLRQWNETQVDFPTDRCIHQLFAAQAAQTPDAIALAFAGRSITYQALNDRANQLAHELQQLGVQPEVLVGLCCDRSPEWVIGMLAILKAGGAYVPLDSHSPPERLSGMLTDAQVSILLTQQQVAARLGWQQPHDSSFGKLQSDRPCRSLWIDQDWEAIVQPSANPVSTVTADHLAYVIYTSGSTGEPKGVQIEHWGLLNLVFWHQRAFQVSGRDRATQIAAPAFDACTWEVLPYLAAGASLHFPDDAIRTAPVALRDWLIQEHITLSFMPTPLAEQMLSLTWQGAALRSLLVGGDRLRTAPPAVPFTVVNNYGPTETTVVATSGTVLAEPGVPDIGRPIANVEVYVLDAHLQPVPIGVSGELYLGGVGLARGYLNRPQQTAASFIPHPWSTEPGARLYKTGDRVRYRSNGQLEFLGRLDQQVKIRGFRIELAEIERAIAQHPSVRAAVVVVKAFANGDRRLVAYVEMNSIQAQPPAEFRQFLKPKLPEYMIPTAFVVLETLPLTTNGKVDYRALADLEIPTAKAATAPRTAIETTLVHIWAELLDHKQVGVDDNFFAIGGHSLLATQLTSRIRDALQVEVPLPVLFESPTVAAIAAYVETVRWATAEMPASQPDSSEASKGTDRREEVEF